MKHRADSLLVQRGLCADIQTARRLIMAGAVRIGPDRVVSKPAEAFPDSTVLRVHEARRYVSRAAHKLLPALRCFRPPLQDIVALDVGASTGGFTDLLLQSGARRVYAVDVGYGILHGKLRTDPRVICLERHNARHLPKTRIPDPIDLLAVDVSFISVTKVLPSADTFLRPDGWAFILVKPQFEAPRKDVGHGGIVQRPEVRRFCVTRVCRFAETALSWRLEGIVSPALRGQSGNQEYVAVFRGGGGRDATNR